MKINKLPFITHWQNLLKKQEGSALVIVFLCVLVISGMLVALLYSSSTNSIGSGTYRTESETLMVADAGLQKALDWFSATYTPASNPSAIYDLSKSPVVPLSGSGGNSSNPVKFSTYLGQSNNIPSAISASGTSFNTLFGTSGGVSIKDNSNILQGKYVVEATLLSVDITTYSSPLLPIERWAIKIRSAKNFINNANNEISAIIEVGVKATSNPLVVARNDLQVEGGFQTHTINTNGADASSASFPAGFGGYLDSLLSADVGSNKNVVIQTNGPTLVRGSVKRYTGNGGSCSCPSSAIQGSILNQSTAFNIPSPTLPSPGGADLSVSGTTTITATTTTVNKLNITGTLVVDTTSGNKTINALELNVNNGKIAVIGDGVVTLNIKTKVDVIGSNSRVNIDSATSYLRPPKLFKINTGGEDLHFNNGAIVSANVVLTTSGKTAYLEAGSIFIGSLVADVVHVNSDSLGIQDLNNASSVTKNRYRIISWSKNNSF